MTISILGTNGFLSSALGKYFYAQGWEVIMYGLQEPVSHKYHSFAPVNFLSADLDYDRLTKSDIIIYATGAGIQSNLNESASLIYDLNVSVPINICNALKAHNYKGVFVTFGSVFEIGETELRHPFSENDVIASTAPAPNDYAISKRMLTRFIADYKHEYTHWHFIIPTIYGPGENPKRLIPYTINAIKNGDTLRFTSGDQMRQYVFVDEVPNLISVSYERRIPSGIYNIEGSETLSVREIVQLIHKYLDKELPSDCFGTATRTDTGMKYLALDGQKLNHASGFMAQCKLMDVIAKYL